MDPMLVVAGALTGLVVGVTGVGGGALMTPILLLFFGVVPTVAVGTDLWFAAITKLFATRIHHSRGLIDWQVARRLWCGSLPGSLLALWWIRSGGIGRDAYSSLNMVIAAVVVATAIGLIMQARLHKIGRSQRLINESEFKLMQPPLTVLCGLLLGILVTLTSIGAGALGAVCLVYLYPLRLTPPRLVATDIVHAIPLAVCAGLGHLLLGNVDGGLLTNLLLGSIPAVIVGALISSKMEFRLLRWALALILLLAGCKIIWTVINST